MSERVLPEGWVETTLGEMVELKYGKSLPKKTRDGHGCPVYGSNGVVGLHSLPMVEAPGIVIGRKGSNGEVHYSQLPFFPIDTTYYVDDVPGDCLRYWYYQLLSLPLKKLNRSTAIPGLNRADAYAQVVRLPSLCEQKAIADKLDELLAQVNNLKDRLDAIPTILKRFRQSVLAAAVSGRLTSDLRSAMPHIKRQSLDKIYNYWKEKSISEGGRLKSPMLSSYSESGDTLPDCWVKTQIGHVFSVYVGATPSRSEVDFWNGNIPWVSSAEVAFCRINDTKEKITQEGIRSASTELHPKGTVMLAMIGQGKTRGQPAILDVEACHNQNTAALEVPAGFCVSEFLYYYLCEKYEENRTVGGGNNQMALNKKKVQELPFPLPPFEEQGEIVRRVDQLFAFADQVEQQVKNAQTRVDKLTQSILAKAFRGELTAEWRADNPELISGEHSAEALLERIKAEKATLKPAGRGRKTSTYAGESA